MDSELWLSRFEDYARSYRRSESTIQGYLVELRRFLAFLELEFDSPGLIWAQS